jgi:thiamine-phosphate pyrophosphorylase
VNLDLPAARLYLLFTPRLCAGNPFAVLRAALDGGVDLVQWRATPTPGAAVDLQRTAELCRARGVPLVINDDPVLAVRSHAQGAHVGQSDMPAWRAREILGTERWLGVSTHDLAQIRAAEAAGADYLGFGPCFPTATKGYAEGQPAEAIRDAMSATLLPVFAIGGITPRNLPQLLDLGVRRVAVSSCILQADDPGDVAATLARMLANGSATRTS